MGKVSQHIPPVYPREHVAKLDEFRNREGVTGSAATGNGRCEGVLKKTLSNDV